MQTVHKYLLGRENNVPVKIPVPEDAIVLHVEYDMNSDQFCAWAIVMTETAGLEDRTFYISGTGKNLANHLKGDEEMLHVNSFCVQPNRQPGHPVGWFHAFEVRAAASE